MENYFKSWRKLLVIGNNDNISEEDTNSLMSKYKELIYGPIAVGTMSLLYGISLFRRGYFFTVPTVFNEVKAVVFIMVTNSITTFSAFALISLRLHKEGDMIYEKYLEKGVFDEKDIRTVDDPNYLAHQNL